MMTITIAPKYYLESNVEDHGARSKDVPDNKLFSRIQFELWASFRISTRSYYEKGSTIRAGNKTQMLISDFFLAHPCKLHVMKHNTANAKELYCSVICSIFCIDSLSVLFLYPPHRGYIHFVNTYVTPRNIDLGP